MVCLTCFIIPIGLWIWFQFVLPIIIKIKSLIFPGEVATENDKKSESNKYECPFDFCKKKDEEIKTDVQQSLPEEKKDI